jgi:hypothetical protein
VRTIGATAVTLAVLVAALSIPNFGTLPPCGLLRETARPPGCGAS